MRTEEWKFMPEATRSVKETELFVLELKTTSLEPACNGSISLSFKRPVLWMAFHIRQPFVERNLSDYLEVSRREAKAHLDEVIDMFLNYHLRPQLERAANDILNKHYPAAPVKEEE